MARTKDIIEQSKSCRGYFIRFLYEVFEKIEVKQCKQFPYMESECPYYEMDWNINLDFLKNYTWTMETC